MHICIRHLAPDTNDQELRRAFETYGEVGNAFVLTHAHSGSARAFGFVHMPNEAAANAAIQGLNASTLQGQTIHVNETLPRTGWEHRN